MFSVSLPMRVPVMPSLHVTVVPLKYWGVRTEVYHFPLMWVITAERLPHDVLSEPLEVCVSWVVLAGAPRLEHCMEARSCPLCDDNRGT